MKESENSSDYRKKLRGQLQFLGQTASTETALFHQKAAERYGMGITEMKALSVLMQEGDMAAGELAVRLNLTTGAVTNLLDRLEKRKAIRRLADPSDRRKVIVQANLKAWQKAGNIYESIGETFDELARNYTTEDLEFLVEFYKQSIELTKREITKLGKGAANRATTDE